jgi:hypothetical protein
MQYAGHIENGKVILDDEVTLPDGLQVVVVPQPIEQRAPGGMSLRGTPCQFDDPFAPAVPEEDWEALR